MSQQRSLSAVAVALLLAAMACQAAPEATDETPPPSPPTPPPSVVEITTTNYAFNAPPSFPSGWVTLHLTNEAEEPHFMTLTRLPEGHTFEEYSRDVAGPFAALYKEYRAGTLDQAEFFAQLTAALPAWFPAEARGGVALTSPGQSAQTTVYLEPGDYVMECYVRPPDPEGDKFHGELGMLRPLVVTAESTDATPPEADVEITLSNYEITVEGELTAGTHTIAVHVAEAPEGLIGHDVNLVRLEPDDDLTEIAAWMSWVDALQSPAPALFLGGAEQAEPGLTSYVTIDLDPGRYAWVSEGYGAQGMVKEFTIQ
ncbi:MAG: hypothetical protein PVJ49_02485 [Acidobacteriota bacterium]|jgi:hypothetical protein